MDVKKPKSGRVLVIGAGNVGSVAIHKMAQRADIFKEIHVATRHRGRTASLFSSVLNKVKNRPLLFSHEVDASSYGQMVALIKKVDPDLVMNLGPPYWNLVVMQACLHCGVHYLDTACHESPEQYGFSNVPQLQWNVHFQESGLIAQLQIGFDPGVTNVMVAYCYQEKILDRIDSVDILDCNNGEKDVVWAPNFDPEINLRELILPIRAIHNGEWTEHGRLIDKVTHHFTFNFPEAGQAVPYLMYHEELESLHETFPEIKRMRFWMTFSSEYLNFLRVLHTVGMTRIDPVMHHGQSIVPVQFLKTLLPKGEEFNKSYTGKTNIGCIIKGIKDGDEKVIYTYQVCDHREAFLETSGNAIGYTTAVPAVTGAIMMLGEDGNGGPWLQKPGVFVPEVQPAKVFLEELAKNGLPWQVAERNRLPIYLDQNLVGP